MMSVDILLATYNGETYINQLIYSVLGQTFNNWRLIIHDDGSNDNTIKLIKQKIDIDDRIVLVEDNIRFGNPAKNFLYLLQYSSADYIMFCDQDDIWLENKIEKMLNRISEKNNERLQAVFSKAHLYDAESGRIYGKESLASPRTLNDLLFLNGGVLGCTIMVNNKILPFLKVPPKQVAMHDHLICLIAATFGEVDIIDEKLMLYRQHNKNVTGNQAGSFAKKTLTFFNKNLSVIDRNHYEATISFFEQYKEYISNNSIKIITAYIKFPKVNILHRIFLIYKFRFNLFGSCNLLFFKTLTRKALN